MKKIGIVCISALFFSQISTLSAEMYRWTDSDGNVVYSQSPPPDGRDSSIIAPPAAPPAGESEKARQRLQTQTEKAKAQDEARMTANEEASEKRAAAAAMQEQCEVARKNLEMIQSRPPNTLYSMDGGKDYRRFTPEEWDAKVKTYQDAIKKNCK